jgi:uncharacterized membrane protein YfcA
MTGTIISFLAAVLSGLGVGSGGLYLLYLTDVLGTPQYTAQGQNLIFFSVSTLAATLTSVLHGRLPLFRLLPVLLGGSVGCLLGSLLTRLVPAEGARHLLGLFLLSCGLFTLFRMLRRGRTRTRAR